MRWTVERVIADPDGFGDWLAVTPDDDPEAIRIGKELAEAWQAELDSMSPAERKAWLAFLDGDGDDDPGGGTPVELPLPPELAEPDTRGPPIHENRPPEGDPGRAAMAVSGLALPQRHHSPAPAPAQSGRQP